MIEMINFYTVAVKCKFITTTYPELIRLEIEPSAERNLSFDFKLNWSLMYDKKKKKMYIYREPTSCLSRLCEVWFWLVTQTYLTPFGEEF